MSVEKTMCARVLVDCVRASKPQLQFLPIYVLVIPAAFRTSRRIIETDSIMFRLHQWFSNSVTDLCVQIWKHIWVV